MSDQNYNKNKLKMFQERIENIDKEAGGKTIKVIQEIEKEPGRTVRNEKCKN